MRLRPATAPGGSLPALDEGDGQKQQVFGHGLQNQRLQDLCSVECAGGKVRALGLQGLSSNHQGNHGPKRALCEVQAL